MSSTIELMSHVITMEFSTSHTTNKGSSRLGAIFYSGEITYLPLAMNIHPNTLGPTKKVILVKSNGGDLDSGSVGMNPIVEDFGSRYLSL